MGWPAPNQGVLSGLKRPYILSVSNACSGRLTFSSRQVLPFFQGTSDVTSQKAIVSGLSGRYALAIFDLAIENNALQAVESDFASLHTMLAESEDFGVLVNSPVITGEEQGQGVAAIADKAGFSPLTAKFLGVLAANRRLTSLKSVMDAFDRLAADHRGEVSASVVSASELTDAQMKSLQKNLKAAIGQDVAIDQMVDESLLGGLKVKVGSRMIDSSLKTKLDNLAIAMKGVQ